MHVNNEYPFESLLIHLAGDVLPWMAEEPYPYDQAAGDFDEPA
jgi:hypothetical protein